MAVGAFNVTWYRKLSECQLLHSIGDYSFIHDLLLNRLWYDDLRNVGVKPKCIYAILRRVFLHFHIVVHRLFNLRLFMTMSECFEGRRMMAKLMRWEGLSVMWWWKAKRIWILEDMRGHGLRMRVEAMSSDVVRGLASM